MPSKHERACITLSSAEEWELSRQWRAAWEDVRKAAAEAEREALLAAVRHAVEGVSSAAAHRRLPARGLPAWERLVVPDGAQHVELDGKRHRLCGADDAEFLRILICAKGSGVPAQAITRRLKVRADRMYKRLPNPIQKLIAPPGRGNRVGYHLR